MSIHKKIVFLGYLMVGVFVPFYILIIPLSMANAEQYFYYAEGKRIEIKPISGKLAFQFKTRLSKEKKKTLVEKSGFKYSVEQP